ncbi:MAG: AMP-binding protein [bacterium]|nr:AMP-binding protein [bacterium]
MSRDTVCYYIENLIQYYKNRPALIFRKGFRTEQWSYSDLYNYAHRIAGLFEEKKLKKGDKILIYCYNCPEWCALLMACALSGVIAVPIDFNSKKEFILSISKKVKPKILFSSRCKPIRANNEIFIEHLFEHIEKHHKYRCKANVKGDDILEIVYTSGTTSEPKGVIITNKNLVSNVHALRLVMPLPHNLVFLSVVPLSHMLEQTAGFFIPLRFGCKIVYTTSRKSTTLKEAMREENVSAIVGVPILLRTFKDKIEAEIEKRGKSKRFANTVKLARKLPFSARRRIFRKIINQLSKNLKFFVVGGAPLDKSTEEFWNSLGILVLQGYGLTETSPIISCNTFKHHKEGSVGRVLPYQEVNIAKDGEIICKGSNVTPGYYQNKQATDAAIINSWFHTGDLGEFDEDNFLIIKGRKKNMILTSSGLNVYPEDIENVINRLHNVKDSCVMGIQDKKDIIITAVVLPENNAINKSKILNDANSQLPSHQQVQRLIIWSKKDFPRTPSFKIKRKELEKALEKKTEEKETTSNKLYRILSDLSNTNISRIKPQSVLSTDLAIDSLHRVELLASIEDEYDLELEEDKITSKTTVLDVENLIKKGSSIKNLMNITRLNTSKWVLPLRYVLQIKAFAFLRFFYPLKVRGKENLKNIKGPVIFALNHTSHIDTPTLLRALPPKLRYRLAVAAAQDYFFETKEGENRLFKKIKVFMLKLVLNTYPFSRDKNIRNSLKLTGKLLDKGFSIAIYPEGTRTVSGKMGNFKVGLGLIASSMDVPVVPVKTEGLFNILPKGKRFPKSGKASLSFGKPLTIDKHESYISITKKIEKEVRDL